MRRRFQQLLRPLAITAAFLLCAHAALAYTLICRAPGGIQGFDNHAARAKGHVGGETKSMSDMKVYVSAEGDQLYLHSNFLTGTSEVPTKLTTDEIKLGLSLLVYNLVGEQKYSRVSQAEFRRGLKDITYYVEQGTLTDPKFKSLGLDRMEKLLVVDSEGKARQTKKVNGGGRTRLAMEFEPSLFRLVDDPNGPNLKSLYNSLSFRPGDVRLLPLTVDSMTVAAIGEKIPASNTVRFDLSSAEALDRSLAAHRGTTVFALGHIENDAFAVKDAGNKVVFSITLAELEASAKRHNIKLFALGCNSADSTRTVGVLNVFNTLDAVHRYADALTATNYMQFFDKLAAEDIFILLDESVVGRARERLSMTIYRGGGGGGNGGGGGGGNGGGGGGGGSRSLPVGKLIVMNPATTSTVVPLSTPTPTPEGGPDSAGGQSQDSEEPVLAPGQDENASEPEQGRGGGIMVWVLALGGLMVSGIWAVSRYRGQ